MKVLTDVAYITALQTMLVIWCQNVGFIYCNWIQQHFVTFGPKLGASQSCAVFEVCVSAP